MKKKVWAISLLVLVWISQYQYSQSSAGAPTASTGAPGEGNCSMPGCHVDFAANSGSGKVEILLPKNHYSPKEELEVTVQVSDAAMKKTGYELTALDDVGNAVGAFEPTDNYRTQLLPGTGKFANRNYMTYTANGTNVSNNTGIWKMKWKAGNSIGAVHFYAAGTAADGDGTQAGDYVFTTSKTIGEAIGVGQLENKTDAFFCCSTSSIYVAESMLLNLFDLNGKLILQNKQVSENISLSYLPKGIYLARLTSSYGTETLKLMLP
ncbi:MAG: T9SS type A sorting domain-containing protein [Flavobacteriaceae bacterium]|nr:T9SS type A sorting domain-containing protein [Flavobacteriaceae bacterium]